MSRQLQTTGFAIVGPGIVAEMHRRAIEANDDLGARLVALAHYNPARYDELSQRFGVPCRSYEEVLNDLAVEVVCICTPNGQHAAQTIAAARAGKHVLVEKPMAVTLAEADDMIRACAEAGVTLGVTFQRRAEPVFQQVRQTIEAGALGDLTLGVVTIPYYRGEAYFAQADWRGTWAADGGGVLMNQGIHQVDLLVWYMGDPVTIEAYAGTLQRAIEVEDTLAATLRFANGALATIAATTTAAPGFAHRVEIYGARGGIQIEGESVIRWQLPEGAGLDSLPPENIAPANAGAGGDPRAIPVSGHIGIYRDFIQALRDRRAPLVPGEEGRRSLAVVSGIYEAAGLLS